MNLDYAHRVFERFTQAGFDPVIVGGVAVLIAGYGATNDVDMMVAVSRFDAVEHNFIRDPEVEIVSTTGGWVTNGRFFPDGNRPQVPYVTFDVLNPVKFVGEGHRGDAFFTYVRSRGSRTTEYGRAADPAVVYYTRLLVPGRHGESYLDRISRDLEEGAPESWVEKTRTLARRFGTEAVIQRRLERLEAIRGVTGRKAGGTRSATARRVTGGEDDIRRKR